MIDKPKTGLAQFTKRQTPNVVEKNNEVDPSLNPSLSNSVRRKRGSGNTVSLTVRLKRNDWERLHQLAVSEGESLQTLAIRGFSKIFAEKGLPVI